MVYFDGGRTSSRLGAFAFWPMLVRRIATVTISAPLASIARRVSSKSRYLPVPTRSRDEYDLPATTSLLSVMFDATQPPPTAITTSTRSPSERRDSPKLL